MKGRIPLNPIVGKDIFLKKIDGITYGHKSNEGFFIKNSFVHKPLRIKFDFDKEFYFLNKPNALIGLTNGKTKIIFDLDDSDKINDLKYIAKWLNISQKNLLILNLLLVMVSMCLRQKLKKINNYL